MLDSELLNKCVFPTLSHAAWRLVLKLETKQVKKKCLFLCITFCFFRHQNDGVSFPLMDPVHQLYWLSTCCYSNTHECGPYIYTHILKHRETQARLLHKNDQLHTQMITGLLYTRLSVGLVWPLVPVPQRGVQMVKWDSVFRVRSPHFGDHKRTEMGGAGLSRRWHQGSHCFHHVDSKHWGAAV